ncbi:helicase C-terminal domain-containing protein [Synechocystis sp. LKSZ1]|uniref:helicase C-terminal domain-containing protein n=1 Tax=Synechocystis sp. LKSZ1 TaxID=3144951 RepID=UPI00336BDEC5
MALLEAQIHDVIKQWLRQATSPPWPHALTLGRLISRALRLKRSALLQTGSLPHRYSCSYLLPCLLNPEAIHLVVTPARRELLQTKELPQLQAWLAEHTSFSSPYHLPTLLTPAEWFAQAAQWTGQNNQLTLIEQADDLEDWARDYFTVEIRPEDWQKWQGQFPHLESALITCYEALKQSLLARPDNPHNCYFLTPEDLACLRQSLALLLSQPVSLPKVQALAPFWQENPEQSLLWASLDRSQGQVTLHLSPLELASYLRPYWPPRQAPLILLGSFLDPERSATTYRQTLGLPDLLCLKFSPQRQTESIRVYLPDALPLPNTPEFQPRVFGQIQDLLHQAAPSQPTVILLDDVPLKAQLASQLAAEFGSRVKVENFPFPANGILISSWSAWLVAQDQRQPQLLILATLPLPSPEHPLVAHRISYCKRHHQDWFRGYLLPTALRALQQAVLPLREGQGTLAILDHRVNSRSYGREILRALEPYGRCSYLDPTDLGEFPSLG